jgi:hypothetical protein
MRLNIYIDESGEAGIAKVREGSAPGASPYFVMGAVVCEPTTEVLAKNTLEKFKDEIGKMKWKHATDLNHSEKVFLGRELGRLPVRYFAVLSNKSTLREYKAQIGSASDKFYNKCLVYLLELICAYVRGRVETEDDLQVILEKRNHNYERLIRFVSKVRANPIYEQSRALSILNPYAIRAVAKGKNEMLEIADFVAHAVFQSANRSRSNFNIPEPRYLQEIGACFAGDTNGRALGVGIKCIHSLEQLNLDRDVEEIFRTLKVRPPASRN